MAKKLSEEEMQNYISKNKVNYLNTFEEKEREQKDSEIELMETKQRYQKIHLRLSNEAKKQSPLYPHLQFIQNCSVDDLNKLQSAITSRLKIIKNTSKKKAQKDIQKILKKYNQMSGDKMTIQYVE